MAVQAMEAGALAFLQKPAPRGELRRRVQQALDADLEQDRHRREREQFRVSVASLSPRERQIMAMVVRGMLSKQIAHECSFSASTIEKHREKVMEKMGVRSVAELATMFTLYGGDLGLEPLTLREPLRQGSPGR